MRLNIVLATAAIAALTAGAAAAQSSSGDNSGMNNSTNAPSADQAGMPAAASTGPVESSPTPAASAYTLKAGDPNVISNPPVPDTPANRALYGKPMSNAGRHTAPAGN